MVGVGVTPGVGVEPHVHEVELEHCELRQRFSIQLRPEAQSALVLHVLLHESGGVAVGVGVTLGVGVGVTLGVGVGVTLGVGVGVPLGVGVGVVLGVGVGVVLGDGVGVGVTLGVGVGVVSVSKTYVHSSATLSAEAQYSPAHGIHCTSRYVPRVKLPDTLLELLLRFWYVPFGVVRYLNSYFVVPGSPPQRKVVWTPGASSAVVVGSSARHSFSSSKATEHR